MNPPQTPKSKKNNVHPKELVTRHDFEWPAADTLVSPAEPLGARSIPKIVLLDNLTLGSLLFKPALMSPNALMILNEEKVRCLVSTLSVMQWADRVRLGSWQLSQPFDVFVQRVLDFFQLTLLPIETDAWRAFATQQTVVSRKKTAEPDLSGRWLMAQAVASKATLLTPHPDFHSQSGKQLKCVW